MTENRNIVENFNWLSRVHDCYRTDDRRDCDAKYPNVTWSRSGKKDQEYNYNDSLLHSRTAYLRLRARKNERMKQA